MKLYLDRVLNILLRIIRNYDTNIKSVEQLINQLIKPVEQLVVISVLPKVATQCNSFFDVLFTSSFNQGIS